VFFERAEGLCGSLLNQIHDSLLKTAQAREEVAPGTAEKILEQITATGGKKVLELLVNAATNKEIGEKLGISLRTVKTHTGNIYGKLGLKNRAQCAKVVRELGIF
jgi:LuxR family maltose regulon positive regulatory protein